MKRKKSVIDFVKKFLILALLMTVIDYWCTWVKRVSAMKSQIEAIYHHFRDKNLEKFWRFFLFSECDQLGKFLVLKKSINFWSLWKQFPCINNSFFYCYLNIYPSLYGTWRKNTKREKEKITIIREKCLAYQRYYPLSMSKEGKSVFFANFLEL